MAISPILLNGTIQQTHEVLQNQTKETHKSSLDQGNIYVQEQKQDQRKASQVMDSNKSRFQEERYDAKEKGHGSYQGDGGKKRHQDQKNDKIVEKQSSGFDMKV